MCVETAAATEIDWTEQSGKQNDHIDVLCTPDMGMSVCFKISYEME